MQVVLLLVSLAGAWPTPPGVTVGVHPQAWESVCVGSLQVSLPGQRITLSQSFDHARVELLPGVRDVDAFRVRVEARAAELRALPHDTEQGRLGALAWQGDHAAILRYREHPASSRAWQIQRFLWLGDRGYVFDSVQAMRPQFADDAARQGAVFEKLAPRTNGERDGLGFCIDGAVVRGDVGKISAGASTQATGAQHVRVWAGSVRHGQRGEAVSANDELAARREAIAQTRRLEPDAASDPEYPREFDVTRQQGRRVAGVTGEEAVWRERLNNGARRHVFRWTGRLNGTENVTIGMDVGDKFKPGEAPPNEETLIALWDQILGSAKTSGQP
ncbi:T6SS immunity protein Tli4 family protein [Luteimonas abyssi]|uniref:T6SS immunity protein Tli4 family protein n=1 Tax=Luteimonas abyssi TaxID=1247514 RepID=UPI0012F72871|nr:T6SS immunity protein Tli4 family protein [Luteimonas abyssi]